MDSIELSLFSSRVNAICEEMGALLRRAAFSPNIRDRLDFSCAIFDSEGELCAQAAHIPVHLGSMAYAMRGIVARFQWNPGDQVVLNDPYLGGTHLPDVTVVGPVFAGDALVGFVANRAHHADIGAATPGSMPVSRSLDEEGLLIAPTRIQKKGEVIQAVLNSLSESTRNPDEAKGDFIAQQSSVSRGSERLSLLIDSMGADSYLGALNSLNEYAEKLATAALMSIPDGCYVFEDLMDDDGMGNTDIPIRASVTIREGSAVVDFVGTAAAVEGNINCPISVAAAAVYYVFRCLMPAHAPACAGSFRPITLRAEEGSLINARRPAAVAAGNVETSTRITDVVMGALALAIPDRIPAASHGSMNNLAMGSAQPGCEWDYYETIGGGMGASSVGNGLSAVQTHMTNTLNTPVEVLEMTFPVRVVQYRIKRDSGGEGKYHGGDGLIREFESLRPATATLLTERRRHSPWGLNGGNAGKPGTNHYNGASLPGKITLEMKPGDRLRIETAGGGGWGVTKR